MGSAVEIALLGEVSARVGGHTFELGPARQRCVLAALAVDVNEAVPVAQLTERVWGTEPPPRSRATLHSYLSRLRQAFAGTDAVTLASRSNGYALVADESAVDILRFRALRDEARRQPDDQAVARTLDQAVQLWRGEPLTGIGGDWAEATRDRLARERPVTPEPKVAHGRRPDDVRKCGQVHEGFVCGRDVHKRTLHGRCGEAEGRRRRDSPAESLQTPAGRRLSRVGSRRPSARRTRGAFVLHESTKAPRV